jgi:hypothetical protein
MPCYSAANVDAQRGRGVFDRSIRGLQLLNEAGYGRPGTGLVLDLVRVLPLCTEARVRAHIHTQTQKKRREGAQRGGKERETEFS